MVGRAWRWIGHTLRKPQRRITRQSLEWKPQRRITRQSLEWKPQRRITRQSLEWKPQSKRKVDRPKKTWRRSIEDKMKMIGTNWGEIKRQHRTESVGGVLLRPYTPRGVQRMKKNVYIYIDMLQQRQKLTDIIFLLIE